jgi:hypothetical protein
MEQEARYFYRINKEWLETLAEVRGLPGFHDFLRPSRLSTLQGAAIDAPVVILNASESGCDALIMTSCDVKHISLPNLNLPVINILVMLIRAATRNHSLSGPFTALINDLFRHMTFVSDAGLSLRQSVEVRYGKMVSDTPVDPEDVFRFVLGILWTSAIQIVIDSLNLEVC